MRRIQSPRSGFRNQPPGRLLECLARRCHVPLSDCEDCVQEAFLTLLIAHPDWPMDAPRTIAWLRVVTRNRAMDYHRGRQRHPSVRLDDLGREPIDKSIPITWTDDEGNGLDSGFEARTQALLEAISEINRQILILRIQENLTFSEIGDTIGLTAQQAKARYNRTVKHLRNRLVPSCDDASKIGGGKLEHLRSGPVVPSLSHRAATLAIQIWV